MVKLDLIAQDKLLNTSYFCNPEVFQSYYGMGDFFSNLSWTIIKVHTEVITIRSLILPLVLYIFKIPFGSYQCSI